MGREEVDAEVLAATLDEAVEAVLTVRVALAPVGEVELPLGALEGVLEGDLLYGAARRRAQDALDRLETVIGREAWQHVLDLEAAQNDASARACSRAYHLGVLRRRAE